jgi:hypothetical protein
MDDKLEKKADVGCAPYAGSGKLTDYKEDGSWMMKQMEKGYDKCDRGIKTIKDENGTIRFAKVDRIASLITASSDEFRIEKTYKQLSSSTRNNYRFALRWAVFGNLDGSTLDDLGIVRELLASRVASDEAKMNPTFNTEFEYCGEAVIDFKKSCIKIDAIVSFECNIVTDVKQITDFLTKLGFEQIKAQDNTPEEPNEEN